MRALLAIILLTTITALAATTHFPAKLVVADFSTEIKQITSGPKHHFFGYITGELRIDPSPCWNRDSTQLLVGAIAKDDQKTRQLYVITIKRN